MFKVGDLWGRILSVSAKALDTGALEPIVTQAQTIDDQGVPFVVRLAMQMLRKPVSSSVRRPRSRPNPFLPYDPELFVADASSTHVCLLNKFNVFDHHLLIVTSQFEHQETKLSCADFSAMWRCMAEYDGLAFYNSGTVAGASQPHKHLQLIPLPLGSKPFGSNGPPVPIDSLLDRSAQETGSVIQIKSIPFSHAVVFWGGDPAGTLQRAASQTHAYYQEMLQLLRIEPSATFPERLARPYNLLITRRWMMMVPRKRECFQSISLNSLAFAGALLVRDESQLAALKTVGPLAAIQSVAEV